MKYIFIFVTLNLVFTFSIYAQGGHKQVAEGNKLYVEEKFDEANNKYRDALIEDPESPIIHFNLGDVLYKKRNYEEAIKSFEKSLSSNDLLMQSKGYYNIGNSLYKSGKLPESIIMYKKALELNPNDQDAKYNLEYVRAKLKDGAQKQPQDQQQNQQQQQQDQQNQDENSEKDQQHQEQQSESENDQNQEEQQQAEETREISKEDAERILDALEKEEQDLLQKHKAKKPGRPFRGKDW